MTKQMMVLIALLIYVVIRGVFIEPNVLDITSYKINNRALAGIRVAFLSDFHLKKNEYKRLDKIITTTNQQKPDLIILGGDYYYGHEERKSMSADLIAQKLNLLNAPKYAVLGDNDWLINGYKIQNALRRNGIIVLENNSILTRIKGKYLTIVGLADLTTRTVQIPRALNRTRNPRIVVTHHPDTYFDIIDNVTLILAGHTHGGQFILPFTKPLFVPSKFGVEFASGKVRKGRNTMIISRGLGTSVLPIRFNCPPEITIIDFY